MSFFCQSVCVVKSIIKDMLVLAALLQIDIKYVIRGAQCLEHDNIKTFCKPCPMVSVNLMLDDWMIT